MCLETKHTKRNSFSAWITSLLWLGTMSLILAPVLREETKTSHYWWEGRGIGLPFLLEAQPQVGLKSPWNPGLNIISFCICCNSINLIQI